MSAAGLISSFCLVPIKYFFFEKFKNVGTGGIWLIRNIGQLESSLQDQKHTCSFASHKGGRDMSQLTPRDRQTPSYFGTGKKIIPKRSLLSLWSCPHPWLVERHERKKKTDGDAVPQLAHDKQTVMHSKPCAEAQLPNSYKLRALHDLRSPSVKYQYKFSILMLFVMSPKPL